MSKRGRPATRSAEPLMLMAWRMVQEEIHKRGAKNVRQACMRIAERGGRVTVMADDGAIVDRFSLAEETDRLRQRYYKAEAARKKPEKYPLLAARCAVLLEAIEGDKARHDAAAAEMRWRKAHNNWRDPWPG